MTKTKKILAYFTVALILFTFSFSSVSALSVNVGGCSGAFCWNYSSGGGGGAFDPNSPLYSGLGLPGGSIIGIMANLLLWILAIFAIIGIIGFVIAGIIYLTSAGDENRAAIAKKALTYCIIGVVVGLSGWILLKAIFYALQAQNTQF